MPLPLPDLDTRQWADLVDEGRGLIPRYAPNWTDHNTHDPGITLLELFASIVELEIYRVNQIPGAHQRKFLQLVHMLPVPPRAARTWVGAAPSQVVLLPDGTGLAAVPPNGARVAFRATSPTTCVPVLLQSVYVQPAPGGPLEDHTHAVASGSPLPALGSHPIAGSAIWFVFDRPLPTDTPVRLALMFDGPGSGADERARIAAEPGFSASLHHSAVLAWEVSMPGGDWLQLDPAAGQVHDDTRALTLDGTIDLRPPQPMGTVEVDGTNRYVVRGRLASGAYDTAPMLESIVVNAVAVEQAVSSVTIFEITPGATIKGTPPEAPGECGLEFTLDTQGRIATLAFALDPVAPSLPFGAYVGPTAGASGALILELESVGRSSGLPDQSIVLSAGPPADNTIRLYTVESTGLVAWDPRPDFDVSTPRDTHFVLDAATRTITFGNGARGRIPAAGRPILAAYSATLGRAGNMATQQRQFGLMPSLQNWARLAHDDLQLQVQRQGVANTLSGDPSTLWSVVSPASYANAVAQFGTISSLVPAAGGQDAEPLDHAIGRTVSAFDAPTRAIGAAEFEVLALSTPGTSIARARALPGQYPPYACLSAPGIVSLVVVPNQATSRPMPSDGLLASVRRYVGRRRMAGTHLEVLPPDYMEVSVSTTVQAFAGVDVQSVSANVVQALQTFLNPIRGGPSRTGWPFGRPVYRAELLQLIDAVGGVDAVLSLEISGAGQPAQCGNLCIGATQLTTSGQHTVQVQPA